MGFPWPDSRHLVGAMVGVPAMAAAAAAPFYLLSELPLSDAASRLGFGAKAAAVSALLTLTLSVEGVAHRRLFDASQEDPTRAAAPDTDMQVDQRVLVQTHEQLTQFSLTLLGWATYATDGRQILAGAATWVTARWIYWAGYRKDPMWRSVGLTGSMIANTAAMQALAVRFGHDLHGRAGAVFCGAPFVVGEIFLVAQAIRAAKKAAAATDKRD